MAINYLITGGSGFIGSNFIRHLLEKEKDVQITNLDKLTYAGNPENLRDIEKDERYEFVKGDICEKGVVDKVMQGKDIVINFAAETHVDRSIQDAASFIKTDVLGTYVLLEAGKEAGVNTFLQVSTDEVYGSVEQGSSKETDVLMPRNPYSASKAGADRLAYSYFTTYAMDVRIARPSNNFGPYQFPEKIIPLFVTNLLQGKKVPLYGDGLYTRDWLYVIDNAKGLKTVLDKGKPGEVYNIGGGNTITNMELTQQILHSMEKGEDVIEHVQDRPGHDRRYCLDSSKVNSLGWKPEKDFNSAIKETIEWYSNNEKWWKPLLKDVVGGNRR